LVRQHTSHVLSLQNIMVRNTGARLSVKQMQELSVAELTKLLPESDQALAVRSGLVVVHTLSQQIKTWEKTVTKPLKHTPAYEPLLTVDGIGSIVAQTITLATGDLRRFPVVGNDASYDRCVQRTKVRNGKRKGQGNVKNGHKYRGWAYMEAAQLAIRSNPRVQRFYQRKQAKAHFMVARKAVAHKLSRACFYIMRDLGPFDADKAFG
jgi:transposase